RFAWDNMCVGIRVDAGQCFVYHVLRITILLLFFFFFQAEDGIRDRTVTGVQTCALPISVLQKQPGNPKALLDFLVVFVRPSRTVECPQRSSLPCGPTSRVHSALRADW